MFFMNYKYILDHYIKPLPIIFQILYRLYFKYTYTYDI